MRARPKDPDILEEMPLSVVTGRSIEEIAEGKGKKRVWHSNRSAADNVKAGATRRQCETCASAARGKTRRARTAPRARPARARKSRKRPRSHGAALPDFVPPSLATLRDTAPNGPGWVHEIKFDGYRMQARLDHGKVKLLTRKGLDWTGKFPNVAAAVAELAGRHRADRRRDRGRGRAAAFGLLGVAGGAQATASATASSITSSICCISTARI